MMLISANDGNRVQTWSFVTGGRQNSLDTVTVEIERVLRRQVRYRQRTVPRIESRNGQKVAIVSTGQ